MCGIAGLIHRGGNAEIGSEMTSMLQALKHRGPDSTGFALYGVPQNGDYMLRFKVAEQEDMAHGFDIHDEVKRRKAEVDLRIQSDGTKIVTEENATEYAFRYRVQFANGASEDQTKLKRLADYIEDIEGAEILSMGRGLELVKDLGDAIRVSDQYQLGTFNGTHAIGHPRMATESDVDIRSAHPYWAYPFSDIGVVHNGQLTNYWTFRRELEGRGHRFMSNCDSELIAVYLADRMASGIALKEAMDLGKDREKKFAGEQAMDNEGFQAAWSSFAEKLNKEFAGHEVRLKKFGTDVRYRKGFTHVMYMALRSQVRGVELKPSAQEVVAGHSFLQELILEGSCYTAGDPFPKKVSELLEANPGIP